MGSYKFIASSTALFIVLNLLITTAPEPVQKTTGLNTTALQSDTDISANVNVNQTNEENVVDQAGSLVDVYTNTSSTNRIFAGLLTVYLFLIIAWLADKVWIG